MPIPGDLHLRSRRGNYHVIPEKIYTTEFQKGNFGLREVADSAGDISRLFGHAGFVLSGCMYRFFQNIDSCFAVSGDFCLTIQCIWLLENRSFGALKS